MSDRKEDMNMVTVCYGSYEEHPDMSGRSVAEIRQAYQVAWRIAGEAIAKVNNKQVSEDYILKDDDRLLFEKNDKKQKLAV
jgi:hypothetical protein